MVERLDDGGDERDLLNTRDLEFDTDLHNNLTMQPLTEQLKHVFLLQSIKVVIQVISITWLFL